MRLLAHPWLIIPAFYYIYVLYFFTRLQFVFQLLNNPIQLLALLQPKSSFVFVAQYDFVFAASWFRVAFDKSVNKLVQFVLKCLFVI